MDQNGGTPVQTPAASVLQPAPQNPTAVNEHNRNRYSLRSIGTALQKIIVARHNGNGRPPGSSNGHEQEGKKSPRRTIAGLKKIWNFVCNHWTYEKKGHYVKTILLLGGTAALLTQIFNMIPWGTYSRYKVWLINWTGVDSFFWVIFFLCLSLVSFFFLFYYPMTNRNFDEQEQTRRPPLHLHENIIWISFLLSVFMLVILLNFINQCKVPYVQIKAEDASSRMGSIEPGGQLMFDLNQWKTVTVAFLSKTEANLVCTWQSDLELDKEIFISDQKSCSPKIKLAISPGPVSASHLILKASTDVCLGRERTVDIKINTK